MPMRWRWLDWPTAARWAATFVCFVGVNWLLLANAKSFEKVPSFIAYQDKIVHFGIFAVLAGLVRWSMPNSTGSVVLRASLVLVLIGYGAGIECIQPLIPHAGRSFEWMDMLMDGLGVLAGLWLCECLACRQPSLVICGTSGEGEGNEPNQPVAS